MSVIGATIATAGDVLRSTKAAKAQKAAMQAQHAINESMVRQHYGFTTQFKVEGNELHRLPSETQLKTELEEIELMTMRLWCNRLERRVAELDESHQEIPYAEWLRWTDELEEWRKKCATE